MTTYMQVTESQKQEVLQAFEKGLIGINYPVSQIKQQYGYSDFLGDGKRHIVDLAAFGGGVASLRTCNIGISVAKEASEDLVRLRALGAPLLFTYDYANARLSRWRMPKSGLPEMLEPSLSIKPDRFGDYFEGNCAEWEPEAFRQARTATFRGETAQLDFFDVGLLPALEGELQRKLSDQIQKIATRSSEMINERGGKSAFELHFASYARLLFRLLAGRLLIDRGDMQAVNLRSDANAVLREVEAKYPDSGSIEEVLNDPLVQNYVWDALLDGLDLRNLSPETLAFVYENTLVDSDLRRRNGIHSTPPQVADYLLRQLPIERLPENDRVVFEPFCGNAPFLLAAMRRLHELLPIEWPPQQVHEYLVARLLGIETLPIAKEIALYSLVLGDYPNDNNWQIARGDVFTDTIFDNYLSQANIVLSNPPHENFPTESRQREAHHNKAAEGLARVLSHPPEMLGFVMPLSFVDGSDYKALRQKLYETYPNISVTALPDNVFGNASQETALITAHRLDTQRCYNWAYISSKDYRSTFLVTGKPTLEESHTELPIGRDKIPILWLRPQGDSSAVWKNLSEHAILSSIATINAGLEHQTGYDGTSDVAKDGFALGVQTINGESVEPYTVISPCFLDIRKESVRRPNKLELPWDKPKVLVSSSRTGRGLWRLVSLHDDEGLYASRNFWFVNTKEQSTLTPTSLAAVLNGPVANAFAAAHNSGRSNDRAHLLSTPIPIMSTVQVEEIERLVDAYELLRLEYVGEPEPWDGILAQQGRRALLKIDAAVLEAYALPTNLEKTLLLQFDGVERGHLPFSFSGYDFDEWGEVKAELSDDREGRRLEDEFVILLRKRNLNGLTFAEQEQYETLQYQRESRRKHYRTLLASGK